MATAKELNDSNFDQAIQGDQPVLVDFWAAWCGPCKMIGPIIEELATEYEGKALIAKVNIDDNAALAGRYSVRSIPTLLLFKGGEVVDKHVGAASKDALTQKLDAHIN